MVDNAVYYCLDFFFKKYLFHIAKGEVSTFAAGPVASLAKQASTLNCQSSTCPVIVIESQNG